MSLFLQVSSQTALVVLYSLLHIRLCLNTNDTTSAMFLRSEQIMILLTFTPSPAWSYLPTFYPLWHSNKPKAQLLDRLHALHNYSITDTFPSSSLISHYSIIFNTSLLSTIPLSTCLSVSYIYFAALPAIQTTALTLSTTYDLSVTLSSSFLSCCCDRMTIFFLPGSPFASRADSVWAMHNDTHYPTFLQMPAQNLLPFMTEADVIKPE